MSQKQKKILPNRQSDLITKLCQFQPKLIISHHKKALNSLFFSFSRVRHVFIFFFVCLCFVSSNEFKASKVRYQEKKKKLCRGRLTAAEPAEEERRTWGAEEAAEGAARCLPAGRAAGSAGQGVSAGPAGAPRGLDRDRGPLRGPGWTPGSAGRSTGTGTSSAGPSNFQPPRATRVPPPSASSTLSWKRKKTRF